MVRFMLPSRTLPRFSDFLPTVVRIEADGFLIDLAVSSSNAVGFPHPILDCFPLIK